MRSPFKKILSQIPLEDAHGGSGKRQMLLSKTDPVSTHFQAMTKGYLPQGGVYDWHDHDKIDEYFLVLQGTGSIAFKDSTKMEYAPDDLIYIPANTAHRIENTGDGENRFFFVRLDA